jgi:hypothetical protein
MTVPISSENDETNVAVEPQSLSLAAIASSTSPESSPLEQFPDQPQESPIAQTTNTIANGDNENDEEDDEITIIGLDEQGESDQQAAALAWIEQNGPEMEERRRNVLLRELQRVQRTSFVHFVLLCLIPTCLLFIVVATVLGEDGECYSEVTNCFKEKRTFINAFTTRCVCDAIDIVDQDGQGN